MARISTKNIFDNGVMVSLRTSCWGATGKLESNKFEVNNSNIDKDNQVKASINLLDDISLIEDMRKIRAKAKIYLESMSIPFPDRGLVFIPKSKVDIVEQELSEFKREFEKTGRKLVRKLKALEQDYAEKYPELYKPNKYPTEQELQSKISFDFVFRVFTPPNEEILPSGLYKKEFSKFKKDVIAMKQSTLAIVQDEMVKRFRALNAQIKNDDKNIHKATLKGVENLIEKFNDIYIDFVDSGVLKSSIRQLKKAFDALDVNDNKADGFKEEIKNMVQATTESLKKDKLFRALDF
jgi:hypothetical protein